MYGAYYAPYEPANVGWVEERNPALRRELAGIPQSFIPAYID